MTFKSAPSTHKDLLRSAGIIIDKFNGYQINEAIVYSMYVMTILKAKSRLVAGGKFVEYSGTIDGCFEINFKGENPIGPIEFGFDNAEGLQDSGSVISYRLTMRDSNGPYENLILNVMSETTPKLRDTKRWISALKNMYGVDCKIDNDFVLIVTLGIHKEWIGENTPSPQKKFFDFLSPKSSQSE